MYDLLQEENVSLQRALREMTLARDVLQTEVLRMRSLYDDSVTNLNIMREEIRKSQIIATTFEHRLVATESENMRLTVEIDSLRNQMKQMRVSGAGNGASPRAIRYLESVSADQTINMFAVPSPSPMLTATPLRTGQNELKGSTMATRNSGKILLSPSPVRVSSSDEQCPPPDSNNAQQSQGVEGQGAEDDNKVNQNNTGEDQNSYEARKLSVEARLQQIEEMRNKIKGLGDDLEDQVKYLGSALLSE
eukprot:PhF_6_TR29009/c0_g1_i1/m.42263